MSAAPSPEIERSTNLNQAQNMTSLSEAHRVMLDAIAVPRLLDCLPNPVLIIQGEAAWLNAPAEELNDWLKRGDPSRSLETELRLALQSTVPPVSLANSTRIALSLKKATGDERAYRVVMLDASRESGAGSVAFVLMEVEGAGLEDHLFATQANSEIARARLEEVQRQLLQADRLSTIGQLAAGVAHEINNPIGYVQSNLVTLADYVSSLFLLIAAQDSVLRQLRTEQTELLAQPEQVRQQIDFDFLSKDLPILLAESQEGITRVRKIIQDLREFSRAGHLESWTMADLHSGIDSTINIVWNDLKYKVELIKHYGDIPAIECLPSQLNQVFMNILVNAGHAIEKRGQITIATHVDGDFVYVEIADTGKGIAPEHLPRVFEPFFTTKAVGQGTGLGLSISYGIVRKHGGEIDVRSEVGAGTMFIVKLPVHQNHDLRNAST
jgi:signal transduction histidine kinase